MAEAELKINVVPQIAGLARPGDTVLIGLADRLSDDELEQLHEDFKEFTETTGVHIALVEGVTSMVVAAPDHECNTVTALDGDNQSLGYVHCGICGRVG